MMRRGFTLIEVMICIAILSIVFAVSSGQWHKNEAWLIDEMDRSRAAEMLANAAATMREVPYETVPPGKGGPWPSTGDPSNVLVPDSGEARHVGPNGFVPLSNAPVLMVNEVEVLGKPTWRDRGFTIATVSGGICLMGDQPYEGEAVSVRYIGRYKVSAWGVHVDSALRPCSNPSAGKLVTLQVYDENHKPLPWLTVTVLRMKP